MKDPERHGHTETTPKAGHEEASSVAEPAAAVRWDDWYQTAGSGPFDYDDSPPAKQATVPETAAYLKAHLGLAVTAYLAGLANVEAVTRCVAGELHPGPQAASRLALAHEAARLLVDFYDDETAQTWFFGMNPHLDEEAPAWVLRHGTREPDWEFVVPAAYGFVGNGF
jgi:hypothetical protein